MELIDQAAVSATEPTTTSISTPKGKQAKKPKGKPSVEARGKRSLNLSIPVEDYERFVIHAMRANITISELFCKLGREHLREYHLTRTATRPTDSRE